MKILHICNDFCWTKVHSNLYKSLDELNIQQTVFTCCRDENLKGRNSFPSNRTNFIYCNILRKYHRFFFHLKAHDVYKALKECIDITLFDCIHATTLFSDGALAYQIKKEYGKPYVVSVRNTDVNTFLGYAPHTWNIGRKILLNASKIVFISKALKIKFCRHIAIKGILHLIEDKFIIQPNGVDDYWLNNIQREEKKGQNILYIGRFDSNKNVIRLIKAVLLLQKQFPNIKLYLVGGKGDQENKLKKIVEKYPRVLHYYGEVYDKDLLKKIYAASDIFAMPSIFETFGLVYIEALSQNLALLYTKGQGIDGLFSSKVGEAVNPLSVKSIASGLSSLLTLRDTYSGNKSIDFEMFRWSFIANVYNEVYCMLLNDK